jgi:CRISPR/Cas system-associated endonuclease Cas3-HD
MSFKKWFNESSLRDLLSPVPQSPIHHEEGNVFVHTRMVRKSLDLAKSLLEDKSYKFPFTNINFNLSQKEEKILKISAWLHDIGKASATTIDGKHWADGGTGKIQAIGHENPNHYLPNIDKISIAKKFLNNLSKEELDNVYFAIDHHMSLKNDAFSKKVMNMILEENGNYKNETKVKLLLYLIVMDWSGRISGQKGGMQGGLDAIKGFVNSANIHKDKNKKNKIAINDPYEFLKSLQGKSTEIIVNAFKNKFGRLPNQEEMKII